mgnify:CR=1 FL=1
MEWMSKLTTQVLLPRKIGKPQRGCLHGREVQIRSQKVFVDNKEIAEYIGREFKEGQVVKDKIQM